MRTFLLTLLLMTVAISLPAEYFTIRHYHADIHVQQDGTVQVSETLKVRFTEPRHGIFRVIPYVYRTADEARGILENRPSISPYFRIWIYGLKVNGYEYETSTDGSLLNVRIGSEDETVDGDQTYVISYDIINAVDEFPDRQELYYNITGVDWQTQIDTATAVVHFPNGFTPAADDIRVYEGLLSSKESGIHRVEGDQLLIGSARPLTAHEGLTFAVRMPKGLVDTTLPWWIRLGRWAWVALPLLVAVVVLVIWLRLGREHSFVKQVHFYPPKDITPAEAGMLTDHMVHNRDIISLIFHWADQGHITITEGEPGSKDYQLSSNGHPNGLWGFEYNLYRAIFSVQSLKYKLAPALQKCRTELNEHARKNAFYVKGTRALRLLMMVLGTAALLGAIITLFVASVSTFFVLSGRYDVPACLLVTGLLLLIPGRKMVRWGPGGRRHIAQLWGFREFIRRAETDRIRQMVDENPAYFGQTLPYAIAFGLADVWAAKFRDLAISPPSWYHGSSLNMMAFTQSIQHATQSIQSNFTATQSSSSGGGGFSGGSGSGIGGGGGGSW
jgi:uncharacterized membrane protein YgcG